MRRWKSATRCTNPSKAVRSAASFLATSVMSARDVRKAWISSWKVLRSARLFCSASNRAQVSSSTWLNRPCADSRSVCFCWSSAARVSSPSRCFSKPSVFCATTDTAASLGSTCSSHASILPGVPATGCPVAASGGAIAPTASDACETLSQLGASAGGCTGTREASAGVDPRSRSTLPSQSSMSGFGGLSMFVGGSRRPDSSASASAGVVSLMVCGWSSAGGIWLSGWPDRRRRLPTPESEMRIPHRASLHRVHWYQVPLADVTRS